MFKIIRIIIFSSVLLITACSTEEEQTGQQPSNDEHFLSEQVQAMEKAKGVEQMLQHGADERQKSADY